MIIIINHTRKQLFTIIILLLHYLLLRHISPWKHNIFRDFVSLYCEFSSSWRSKAIVPVVICSDNVGMISCPSPRGRSSWNHNIDVKITTRTKKHDGVDLNCARKQKKKRPADSGSCQVNLKFLSYFCTSY